ncbi:MAG: 4-hydroxyphenylpyruvate dioxygenase [Gammaproteobacteria bacterium]|nr:4-hydroxyphenylpyruvate dioxygenase [Gammaproteobacteria bacterium]MCW5582390.1 4-hydroxyphenylpyruvate dioxygenase [Gammaproteobacteria bacterium]
MQTNNPAGTDGFDFLEFTTNDPQKLINQFESMGFVPVASHKSHPVTVYQQNDIRFIINLTQDSIASQFADLHGASVSAMGFRVKDAKAAYQHSLTNGAIPYQAIHEQLVYDIPAIYGVGNSLIYFVDYKNDYSNYANHFSTLAAQKVTQQPVGLTYIDHVTHNLHRGNMVEWADFYTRLFNFKEVRYFDIEGKVTGLKSKAMTSPCGKIRIPLNESSDDKSQIEEFLKDFNGEGIQHIALGTNQIYDSVALLRKQGLEFLDTPDTYYDLIEKRLPKHGEPVENLRKNKILIDGSTQNEKKLLLQIFTKNMLGPVFFEIIQRKGDEGFGEGNFRALFESIELDQIRRGVLNVEEEKI